MEAFSVHEQVQAYGRAEDLRGRVLRYAAAAVELYREMDRGERAGRRLADQYLRSATSIGANLEEAQGAESRRDFIHKYGIALKEARESLYWLRLFEASGLMEPVRLSSLKAETDELVAILTTIIRKSRTAPPS